MIHALSVDVEDYFQVLNMQHVIDRAEWDKFELRCGDATRRILEVLERRSARATFFFLGWIAERIPDLVAEVHRAGHEIGSHGYDHKILDDLGRDGFAQDLQRTEAILEPLTGARPTSFRACTWSITRATSWAPGVLCERGYRLDSSIFPVRHPDYGVPGAPGSPYRIDVGGCPLAEFPPLTLQLWGRRLPVGGGGYLRLLPTALLERGLAQQERLGWPGCVYLHPWECDPEQPRQKIGGLRGFRHYVNLDRTLTKLDGLLQRHRFGGLDEAMAQVADRELPVVGVEELLGGS